jgi:GTP-binding protein
MKLPLVAIVGRPNVGKSTLFNRLLSQRQSIVDSEEGITRDRIYGQMDWSGKQLKFIDTGGYIPEDIDVFNKAVREQAVEAMEEADLVLFLVDGKQDLTSSDRYLAQTVRESSKPYILVINKCDTLKLDILKNQFYELGLDRIKPISALNGRNLGDLLDLIITSINFKNESYYEKEQMDLRLAIVGMPNVGKSSLTNTLLNKNRTIVTPIAGTTRDAIDATLIWHRKRITLVDTAGLRKLSKIKDKIEFYSTIRTKNAIETSNVVAVLIDSSKGFGKQDKAILDIVIKSGKGLIIIVNKWDLIDKRTNTMKLFKDDIRSYFKSLDHYPMIFISIITKQRIHQVLEKAWEIFQRGQRTISTKKLNDSLIEIIEKNPPPSESGKVIKIKYATQVSSEPSVIALYTNFPDKIKTSYIRYLENQIRQYFNFQGIPLFLSFRKK